MMTAATKPALRLARRLRGDVITPRHPEYDAARAIDNRCHDSRPAAVVRCADSADVAATVRSAAAEGLPLRSAQADTAPPGSVPSRPAPYRICTGLPRRRLGRLTDELAQPWLAQQESRLQARRGHARMRAEGAGPGHDLPFADRVIATLVILQFQFPHAALAVFYGVHRSTITRAVGEIRPLLAGRGFTVPGKRACGCTAWPMCSPTPPPKDCMRQQAPVIRLHRGLTVDTEPICQPHRDHRRLQAALEREPHTEVGGEAQGADDLSGAQLLGRGPRTVRPTLRRLPAYMITDREPGLGMSVSSDSDRSRRSLKS